MDKKYIADKRNKSNKYKNSKYRKSEITKTNGTGDNYKPQPQPQPQQILEDAIPNNWTRYKLDTPDNITIQDGADYETLLLAPISVDSHFKFKSEQNWDEAVKTQTELSKYFTLNIALLNDGISCVPFVERQGYEESIFSPLELELMKSTSASNLEKYNKTLEKKLKKNIYVAKQEPQTQIPEMKNEEIICEVTPQPSAQIIEDSVDDLLNLKCADLNIDETLIVEDPLLEKIEINKPTPQPTLDLEQWLDDILDD